MNEAGSLVQAASDKDAPLPSMSTSAPVRYADGVVTIAQTDLYSAGFGFPWGQTRSWTNSSLYTAGSDNGNGWVDTYTPHLIQADGSTDNTLIYITNGNTAFYYDLVNGVYQPRISDGSQLSYNSGSDAYTLIDTQGDQILLNGFGASWLTAQRGQFASFTSPGGVTMTATDNSNGQIAQMQRSGGGATQSWQYSYISSGVNAGLLSGVQLLSGGSIVRQVQYAYYDGTQQYGGSVGDLMTATVEDGSGNVLDTSYYRYYTNSANGTGYGHGLEYVFNSDSYARLTAAKGTNLSNLTDADVAPYADNYFQYDSQQRVTQETVQGAGTSQTGGLGVYTFNYTPSTNPAGFNSWAMKTLVGNPDGSTDTVYTNAYGEVLLDDHSGTSHFYAYNFNGQLVLAAAPSAVGTYNDAFSDLLNESPTNFFLSGDGGLITRWDYYASTTATETSSGGVADYLEDEEIEQGTSTPLVPQETWQYYAHSYNGQTIALVASDTVYRNDDGTGAETTSHAYTWYANTAQIQSEIDMPPGISAAENGPGTYDVTTIYYDPFGNVQWTRDAGGYLQYDSYDAATGALVTDIVDVNTANSGEFTNLPSGWSTPSGGGLNLVTTDKVDGLGRTTEETSPNGNITYYVYLDPQHEERIYRGWNGSTFLEPTEVIRDDAADGYTETFTMTATPTWGSGGPNGTEAISGLQSLTRHWTNQAGQVILEDAYYNLNGLTYSTGVMGSVNVNYYQTQYSYDIAGRLYQTQTPNGTLYQTLYNTLDEKVSDWVGTSASNLVEVASYQYDSDGNLTQETDYPGLGAANRVTDYWYDWRDRLVAEKDGVESNENDGVNRPIIVTVYDNLDEVTQTQQYLGDNFTPSIAYGVLQWQAFDPTTLRALENNHYDDQGRLYQTQVFDVNPSSGNVSGALVTNYYYDHRGNPIAESDPGGLWTKSRYDGAGRDVMDYSTDGAGGATWTEAASMANDTVLEQAQTVYDGDGNVTEIIDSQRFHNATGTGQLGSPTSSTNAARVYYSASYYDSADRLIASVDAGTNGGATWTRPGFVPASSPTLLVTQYQYNPAGLVQDTIDPMGIDTRTLYDNLGRTTKTIDDYTGGVPGNENDVATEYGYDGDNNVIYVRADEPNGAYQQTDYVYGVSTATGSAIISNDILSAIQHPDPTTGQPSSSQQDAYQVNALGQVATYADRNGNVHQYSYDVLGRLTSDAVTTLGPGVDGSIRMITYAYDNQGNLSLITSYDAPITNGAIYNQVYRVFNGLGQLTGEYQSHNGAVNTASTPEVQYAYNEMANGENNSRLVSMTYPNGYVLNYNYNSGQDDKISRLSSLSDTTGTLESYLYLGLDTVVERDHSFVSGGSLNLSYIQQSGDTHANSDGGDQYTGLDRFGRVIDQNWISTGSQSPGTVDRYQYGYNQDSEVLYRLNLMDPGTQQNAGMSELYSYDNLGQLTSFARGTLNSSDNAISGTPSRSQSWSADALGNFTSVTTNGTTQTRTANQQNEYTTVSGSTGTPSYDNNGNLRNDGSGTSYGYDAWNRLDWVANNGQYLAQYSYDGLNRLIQAAENSTTDLYYSSSDQVLAEYQGTTVTAYNVWSVVYVNALVVRNVNESGHFQPFYAVQDANWNVTALVNATGGVVVERYAYDPFGAVTVLNPDFSVRGTSNFDVPYGYQDMRVDWFVGLNISNRRIYDPALMRWLQTDPLGLVAGNNGYQMEGNEPIDSVDPSGLDYFKLDPSTGGLYYIRTYLFKSNQAMFVGNEVKMKGQTFVQFGDFLVTKDKLEAALNEHWEEWWNNYPEKLLQWYRANGLLDVPTDIGTLALESDVYNHRDLRGGLRDCREKALEAANEHYIEQPLASVMGGLGGGRGGGGGRRPANMSPPGVGRRGAFNAAKRANGIPASMQPTRVLPNLDRRGNSQQGRLYEFDIRQPNGRIRTVRIRDDAGGHDYGPGNPQNRGPHFNDEAGNHYDY